MKQRLLAFFRFAKTEAKRFLRFAFRHTFSWYGGLFGFFLLLVVLVWLLIYQPTIGEAKRIDFITAEFKAHGCRSIHAEAVPMFETHWLLKHFKLEKKVLYRLTFGPGAVVPQDFLEHPPYLPDLAMISFEGSNPSDDEFVWAIHNLSLRILEISDKHSISFHALRELTQYANRISFFLRRDPDISNDLRALASHSEPLLFDLILQDCELDASCFESLSKFSKLHSLTLIDCTIVSPTGFEKLRDLPLQDLKIYSNRRPGNRTGWLTDDILYDISRIKSLGYLLIPENSAVTERGIEYLKGLSNLHQIDGLPSEKQAEMDEWIRRRIESMP